MTKSAPQARLRLSRSMRILRGSEFTQVYDHGQRISDQILILNGRRNDTRLTRLGLSVSKRCGNAVCRNSWKRRLREAFRLSVAEMPPGLDLVVQPRAPEIRPLDEIRQSLIRLTIRLAKRLPQS